MRARQAEADRIRSAPADDVAGGEDAGSDDGSGGDPVAHGDERAQHAVAVAHRRHAVFELRLRGFEDNLRLPIVIAHQRLVAVVHAAVQRQMDVRVHEPGHEILAGGVDCLGASRNLDGVAGADGSDRPVGNDDDRVRHRCCAVAVDHRGADDRDRAWLRAQNCR